MLIAYTDIAETTLTGELEELRRLLMRHATTDGDAAESARHLLWHTWRTEERALIADAVSLAGVQAASTRASVASLAGVLEDKASVVFDALDELVDYGIQQDVPSFLRDSLDGNDPRTTIASATVAVVLAVWARVAYNGGPA